MEGLTDVTAESETLLGSGEEAVVGLDGFRTCSDFVQHNAWLPFRSFGINKLPSSFKNNAVKNIIEYKAQYTVRIVRNYTSERPSYFKYDTESRCGSGTFFFNEDVGEIKCPSPYCELKSPHKVFGYFKILTAPHIIFNDLEAVQSEVDFFFDDQERTRVITAQGIRIRNIDTDNTPFCILDCISHDPELLGRLRENHKRQEKFLKKIKRESSCSGESLLVFMAHPHGLAKHIAFGQVICKQRRGDEVQFSPDCKIVACDLSYKIPGCLGSGGGSLTEIGKDGSCRTFALHMGKGSDGHRVSGLGWTFT